MKKNYLKKITKYSPLMYKYNLKKNENVYINDKKWFFV